MKKAIGMIMPLCTWVLFALGIYSPLRAQVDTEFWFAAPYVVEQGAANFNLPVYMRFSSYDVSATVTISQPANPGFAPIVFNIPASSTNTIDLSAYIAQIHCTPYDQVLNSGLLITATADISVYYEVASTYCGCNPELFTLKGRNALGREFLLSYQDIYRNNQGYNPRPRSSFQIVATENNTSVTITPTTDLFNHTANVPYTVVLNKGQAYAGSSLGYTAGSQPNGTFVSSDKPVAVTITDDLATPTFGSCADLMGDQTVPIGLAGNEYIVVKGGLSSGEPITILATQNNTDVYINGAATPVATINRGKSYIHYLASPSTSVYINTSLPSYVLHISGYGCELGEALLPPIECTGSRLVNVFRTTGNSFDVNVLARASIVNAFTINGSQALIPPTSFVAVPGTGGQWMAAKLSFPTAQVPIGGVVSIANANGLFHVGVIHQNNGSSGGGCNYGYFSNFSIPILYDNDTVSFCFGDTAVLTTHSSWDSIWWVNLATLDTVSRDTFLRVWQDQDVLLITDLAGCTYIDTITVDENDSMYFNATIQATMCGGGTGSITIDTVVGNLGNYTFTFDGTPQAPPYMGLAAGSYMVGVTDSVGCEANMSIVIQSGGSNLAVQIDSTSPPQCGVTDSSGVISYRITGGTPPYTITLNGALQGSSPTVLLDSLPAGSYSIAVTDANGCYQQLDTVLTLLPFTNINVVQPSTINLCAGQGQLLNAGGNWDSVIWLWGNDTVATSTTWLADTTQLLLVNTTLGACQYFDSVAVWVADSIAVNAIASPINCFGNNNGAATVTVQGGYGGYTYQLNSSAMVPPYSNLGPGQYIVTVIDSLGCTGQTSFAITQPTELTITLDSVSQLGCATSVGKIAYTVTGGTGGINVLLNNTLASTNRQDVLGGLAPGTYTLHATDSNGCTVAVDTTIVQLSIGFDAQATDVSCNGQSDGGLFVTDTIGVPPFQYFLDGSPISLPIGSLPAGIYTLSVTDADGCSDTMALQISEPPLFEIDLDSLITMFMGQDVTLDPSFTIEPVDFEWLPAYGLDCGNCPAPVASPDSSMLYTLTATTANGCVAQASVWVDVLGHVIYVPNVFTPNNDLLNDDFRVYGQGFAEIEFMVFDRWGELIFRTTDIYKGWDGTYKGVLMPPGTYVYTCNYRFYGGYKQLLKGSVLLVR